MHLPFAITTRYAMIQNRHDFSSLQDLKFPQDKYQIARLSLFQKQIWYASKDPHELIQETPLFKAWWFRHYVMPLRIKRLFYKLKFW